MFLWLVCCLLLFMGARGYDWLSHQTWFSIPELSLPWLILGGVGLAIASNRQAFVATTKVVKENPPLTPNTTTASASLPTIVSPPKAITQPASISFKIAADQPVSKASFKDVDKSR